MADSHSHSHSHASDCGCGPADLKSITPLQAAHIASQPRTITCTSVPGATCAYRVPYSLSPAKPTIVAVHSFGTDSTLYRPQYNDVRIQDAVNFVAVDLLGHGATISDGNGWSYWDSARMALEVLDRIGVKRAWAMGTSQGGWVAVMMALLAPETIVGVLPIGTSMAAETPHTVELGCWDGPAGLTPLVEGFSSEKATPGFVPPEDFIEFLMKVGWGSMLGAEEKEYWTKKIRVTYAGDEGRKKLQHATQILRDREGLDDRLAEIKAPVLWFHGAEDEVFSVANAKEGIAGMKNSKEARLEVVEDGPHFLGATHPDIVMSKTLEFIKKYES